MNIANPLNDFGKIFLVIGIAVAVVGALLLFDVTLPFRGDCRATSPTKGVTAASISRSPPALF